MAIFSGIQLLLSTGEDHALQIYNKIGKETYKINLCD